MYEFLFWKTNVFMSFTTEEPNITTNFYPQFQCLLYEVRLRPVRIADFGVALLENISSIN